MTKEAKVRRPTLMSCSALHSCSLCQPERLTVIRIFTHTRDTCTGSRMFTPAQDTCTHSTRLCPGLPPGTSLVLSPHFCLSPLCLSAGLLKISEVAMWWEGQSLHLPIPPECPTSLAILGRSFPQAPSHHKTAVNPGNTVL